MGAALDDVKVLDFSQVMAGPMCTQMLADFGADVVKVERLGSGDSIARFSSIMGWQVQGVGNTFLALNRNKRSLSIDLQQSDGKRIIKQLANCSDVLVENFRPGVMERLGLGYDDLSETNPRLIYASVSGYGQTGPYRDRKGQDIMAQGLSGITWLNGARDDPPTLVGMPMADFAGSMVLCQGILIALHARERSGRGQRIETSLLNGMLFPRLQDIQLYLNTRNMPARPPRGGSRPNHGPTSGVFRAKDGYVIATVVFDTGSLVSGMCRILGLPDLGADSRFNTREKALERFEELHQIFEAEFAKKTMAEWVDVFEKADAMCVPAYTYKEVCEDSQVLHNEMIVEIDHPKGGTIKTLGNPLKMYGTPWQVRNGPPGVGAHTDEILSELGLSMDQIADLRQRRVVM